MISFREFRRRVRNFFIGPYFDLALERRDYVHSDFEHNSITHTTQPVRFIYIIPIPSFLRWHENPKLHFKRLGIVEVDWLVWTWGWYWQDNN